MGISPAVGFSGFFSIGHNKTMSVPCMIKKFNNFFDVLSYRGRSRNNQERYVPPIAIVTNSTVCRSRLTTAPGSGGNVIKCIPKYAGGSPGEDSQGGKSTAKINSPTIM